MARIIQKSDGEDVLEVVKWQELFVIYVQSIFFNFFIVCKNVLLSLKRYFDNRFAPTRQHITDKFPALSLIGSSEAKVLKDQRSIACPRQLMEPQLGHHKYIKLKVRRDLLGQAMRNALWTRESLSMDNFFFHFVDATRF